MSDRRIDPSAVPAPVRELARRIEARGGRALVVGGWVRDRLRGEAPVDLDLEVHGLEQEALDAALGEIGKVHVVGKAFAIRRVRGLDADVSWVAPAQGAVLSNDDALDRAYAEAAARRDLTINAMAFDPLAARVLDPFGGIDDLELRRLRATDARRFGEDPVRALRVAIFSCSWTLTDNIRRSSCRNCWTPRKPRARDWLTKLLPIRWPQHANGC